MKQDFLCPMVEQFTCVAPTGHVIPCCEFHLTSLQDFKKIEETDPHSSRGFQELKKSFRAGRWPKGCERCQIQEKMKQQSLRQSLPQGAPGRRRNGFLQIRTSNLCALQCRTCNAANSSSIAKARGLKKPVVGLSEQQMEILLDLIDKNTKALYFSGGEPLLDPRHLQLLHNLRQRRLFPKLSYSTSLNVPKSQLAKIKKLWKGFPRLQVLLSLDGPGRQNADIRVGSKAQLVEQNLKALPKRAEIFVNTVVSKLNVNLLPGLFHYVENELGISADHHVLSTLVFPRTLRPPHLLPESESTSNRVAD